MIRISLILCCTFFSLAVPLIAIGSPSHDYEEIEWTDLEMPGHGLEDVVKKYETQIDALDDNDPEAVALMGKIEAEFNELPVNPAMNGKKVKLAGFIAPLDVDNSSGMLKTFLLVPYFGACIHVPPPPPIMVVMVEPQEGESVHMDDSYFPIWVYGTISSEKASTELAEAGYTINNARVEIMPENTQ